MKEATGAPPRQHIQNDPSNPGLRPPVALAGGLALAIVTLAAYWPGLGGGFVWDDPDYVVNNATLRSAEGLVRMWTDFRSLPQWYPLVHTTYWIEYQLFGLNPLVFKITNLVLHIATALLLWRLLRVLGVPGAYLGALVFAVHPVHVESVTWITERKNTLSGLFYLAAFGAYGKWRRGVGAWSPEGAAAPAESKRQNLLYLAAVALFACALLSKTVTATLPAAILVVLWWKTGRVQFRDAVALLPFLAMGVAMGSLTAWLERHHVGAVGPEWDHAPVERVLIAGRAAWFYFGKLIWPVNLAFMYERWTIDPRSPLQWLYPVSAAAVAITLLLLRNRIGRGPAACALLFGGTLLPALGFFNVYPHRYSFVADHFQHLASIAVTSGLAALLASRAGRAAPAVGVVLIGVLATLTFRQARVYESPVTLWLDTAAKSPGNWIAWTQLGRSLADERQIDGAVAAHRRAFELNPTVPDTCYNMAMVYARQNRTDDAEAMLRRTIELSSPKAALHLDAMIKLGLLYEDQRNDPATAEQWYRRSVETGPGYPPAERAYADFLRRRGRG